VLLLALAGVITTVLAGAESSTTRADEAWLGPRGRSVNPGLVLYAMADGGFALWGSAHDAWKQRGSIDEQDKIKAYVYQRTGGSARTPQC